MENKKITSLSKTICILCLNMTKTIRLKFKINCEKRYWDFEYVHLLIFVINSKYLINYKQ